MKHAPAGYSLIEILVAMSLFAITSLATAQLMLGATKLVSGNELASEAITIAQEELENLRALPFADMSTSSEPMAAPSSRGGMTFSITRTVSADEEDGVKRVGVIVLIQQRVYTRFYK